MRDRFFAGMILALLITLIVIAGCGRKRNEESGGAQDVWTPAPITGTLQLATSSAAILPTLTPAPTAVPAETRPLVVAATATTDPGVVIITEADVLRAVTSGAAAENGADLRGVGVEFTQGKMRLTAERASYGFVNVDNLVLVGRLVAANGKLQLQTESISPGGIVTALIPTLANQALQNYASKWYVEDVQTLENRLELRVRR